MGSEGRTSRMANKMTNVKYVVCLPFRVKEFRDEFMNNCKLDNILEIDNTVNNIGIMASHNLGIK